jgi:hypothetical protein
MRRSSTRRSRRGSPQHRRDIALRPRSIECLSPFNSADYQPRRRGELTARRGHEETTPTMSETPAEPLAEHSTNGAGAVRAIVRDEVRRVLPTLLAELAAPPAEDGDRLGALVDALSAASTTPARRAAAEALADAIERRPAARRRGYVVFVLLRATERRR